MYFNLGQVKMFRAPTARANVAYCVVKVEQVAKKPEVEATILAIVLRKLRKYKVSKIVVYSNLVAKVKALAEKLECQVLPSSPRLCRGVKTAHIREELKDWTEVLLYVAINSICSESEEAGTA
jgi:hypothetical protein